jgi:hypothetical protein
MHPAIKTAAILESLGLADTLELAASALADTAQQAEATWSAWLELPPRLRQQIDSDRAAHLDSHRREAQAAAARFARNAWIALPVTLRLVSTTSPQSEQYVPLLALDRATATHVRVIALEIAFA